MSGVLNILPAVYLGGIPTIGTYGTEVTIGTDTAADAQFCCGTGSSTNFMYFYKSNTDGYIYATKLTVSGTTITVVLTPASVVSSSVTLKSVTQIGSSSSALVVYLDSTTLYAVAVDYSGSTPTVGTPVSVDTSISGEAVCGSFDGGNLVVIYRKSLAMIYRVLTVSGTALTVGSSTSSSDNEIAFDIEIIDSTNAIVVSQNASANQIKARIITLSSGSITENTVYGLISGSSIGFRIKIADSGSSKYFCSWTSGTNVASFSLMTVSGTVITSTSPLPGYQTNASALIGGMKTSSALSFTQSSSNRQMQELLNSSGTPFIKLPNVQPGSTGGFTADMTKISTTTAMCAYKSTANAPKAVIVSIT